ncbi:conserved exported hypothetical protein [Luteimonas sp. 9C]|uniref:outer membrane protein n=1 Tax=Luteimonas sp. 9C TaxID=2653148 RepID=UPI0012F2D609|nr:outer membrane beta-barrel protein [Luteimonas sp. 9C]VXA93353.1 conserved exported hypothetical protein [Luteimonas sp. 9C]
MKMIHAASASIALLAASTGAALAQSTDDTWTGGYVGLYGGVTDSPEDNSDDRFVFDTNLDRVYGDTVRTGAGADAFSPGFCNGAARGATPALGCTENDGGADYGVRGGYDWQMGSWVFGVVGEYGANDVRDAVTAFSTTPAYYTMFRKVDRVAALRLRSGYAFGADSANLVYLTGGMAHAKIDNEFTTSNGANSFTTNGDTSGFGWQAGVGYERKLGENVSVGLEYLFTSLEADDQRVRTGPGTAPATNPFLIVNPAGTDMRRSDKDFDYGAARATVNWRF